MHIPRIFKGPLVSWLKHPTRKEPKVRFKIQPEVVLANYLFYNPKGSLDSLKLGKIKENIFNHAISCLYVDVKDDSIVGAVEANGYLFEWDKDNTDNIIRAKGSDPYFNEEHLKAINYGAPPDILDAVQKACQMSYETD